MVAVFAGLVRALKTTLELVRRPAVDPKAGELDAIEQMGDEVAAQQAEGEGKLGELKDTSSEGGAEGKGELTEALARRRAALTDPDAVKGFDAKWEEVGHDVGKMQRALDGMEKAGDLDTMLARFWQRTRSKAPGDPFGEGAAELGALEAAYDKLRTDAESYEAQHPDVAGLRRLIKDIEGEQAGLTKRLNGQEKTTIANIDGLRGNLDGLRAELDTAMAEADVTGLSQRFTLDGKPKAVDVDVVADNGRRWVESKSVEPFGKQSSTWTKMNDQIIKLLRAADQNPVDGQPPQVVVRFSKGVSWQVANALEQLGVEVIGDRCYLPEVGPLPARKEDEQ